MEKKSDRLGEMFDRLQDPELVARFQRFCGVHGSFSRAAGGTSSSSGSRTEAGRAPSHYNGACVHHHPAAENQAGMGAGEGEKVEAAAGARKRITGSDVQKTTGEESGNPAQNGAVLSAGSAGGEALCAGRNGAAAAPDHGAPGPTVSSTVKPLRKNSLTGEAGHEFLIENRFLYYMFTFGTELGNESFYITFFPFIMWNMDVFVSRRLIMVWVWVMYLGQCTKDVIGWSRPASPPVVKVEMFYNSEYSMPSTHAMSGTAIPFSLFFMTYGRWEVQCTHSVL